MKADHTVPKDYKQKFGFDFFLRQRLGSSTQPFYWVSRFHSAGERHPESIICDSVGPDVAKARSRLQRTTVKTDSCPLEQSRRYLIHQISEFTKTSGWNRRIIVMGRRMARSNDACFRPVRMNMLVVDQSSHSHFLEAASENQINPAHRFVGWRKLPDSFHLAVGVLFPTSLNTGSERLQIAVRYRHPSEIGFTSRIAWCKRLPSQYKIGCAGQSIQGLEPSPKWPLVEPRFRSTNH